MATTAEQTRSLLYYWNDKNDPKLGCDYKEWARANVGEALELDRLLSDWEWAEERITLYLEKLVEKAEEVVE